MSFFRELLGYLSQVINFKDANVKRRLLASPSVNPDGSGDIMYSEAVNVSASTLHSLLSGQTDIVSFNELQYFTNYGDLPTNFLKDCENLEEIQFPVVSQWPTTYGTDILANTNVTKLDLRGVTKVNTGATFGSMASLEEVWINDLTNISSQIFSASKHPNVERVVISDESQWVSMTISTNSNPRPTAGGNATLYKGDLEHPITEFVIPSTVSSITHYTFDNIKTLTKIIIEGNNVSCGARSFSNLPSTTTIVGYGNLISIGSEAFVDCQAQGITGVPPTTEIIGKSAYRGSSIQTVISQNLYSLDQISFNNCTSLSQVDIDISNSHPNSKISLNLGTFAGCTALRTVYLKPIETITQNAFNGCTLLRSCECVGLTSISSGAFKNCSSLVSFRNAAALVNVANQAFLSCSSLTDFDFIIDRLVTIGYSAFSYCSHIACPSIFGNQLTKIGAFAFYGCDYTNTGTTIRLTSASMVEYEENALGSTPQEKYKSPFDSSVTKIQVPSGLKSTYEGDSKWSQVISYTGIQFEEYTA